MARHRIDVRQLQPDIGTAFANVSDDPTGVVLWSHYNGGGDVRFRICGNVVWVRFGESRYVSEEDLAGWRELTKDGTEYHVVDGKLCVVPASGGTTDG